MAKEIAPITAEIVNETVQYSLKEVCEVCGVHAECVVEMVEAGIIEPRGDKPTSWRFSTCISHAVAQGVATAAGSRDQHSRRCRSPGFAGRSGLLRGQVKALKQQLEKLQQ